MNTAGYPVVACLLALAAAAITVSLNILLRNRVYERLKPESRPRKWVLFALLVVFAVFAVWFPVWMTWPQSVVAKALTLTFAVVFSAVGLTLSSFTRAVDLFVERKGWPLR